MIEYLEPDSRGELITEIWCQLTHPKPISINKAYSGVGNRFLTAAGRAFKDALASSLSAALVESPVPWNTVIDFVYKQGGRIDLEIWLFVDDLSNKSWRVGGCMTKPTGNKPAHARSPWTKRDADNYVKLVQDAVTKATGIDDSAVLDVSIHKRQSKNPRVVLAYRVFE